MRTITCVLRPSFEIVPYFPKILSLLNSLIIERKCCLLIVPSNTPKSISGVEFGFLRMLTFQIFWLCQYILKSTRILKKDREFIELPMYQ